MAKKKGKRKTTRRRTGRRSRVSGIGAVGIPFETIAAIGAGAIASQALNGVAQNVPALQKNPKILPLVKVGLGVLALTKSNNEMIQNVGGGMIADGVLQGMRTFAPNVFKGLAGDMPGVGALVSLDDAVGYFEQDHAVAGYQDENDYVAAI